MKRHTRTQRLPREHFEAEERPVLLPAPTAPFDVPLWTDCKVARDQFAAVAKSLYSLPFELRGHRLRARADSQLVHFYEHGKLVKTHPRKAPGQRSIDRADFPEHALAANPLPWSRLRCLFKLLGLAKKFGSVRLDGACKTALDAEMVDIYRLERLVRIDARLEPPVAKVIPLARYLRPASQYALPLASRGRTDEGDEP